MSVLLACRGRKRNERAKRGNMAVRQQAGRLRTICPPRLHDPGIFRGSEHHLENEPWWRQTGRVCTARPRVPAVDRPWSKTS